LDIKHIWTNWKNDYLGETRFLKEYLMKKTIQVLKPYFRVEEVLSEIRECLDKGWTGIGFKTDQFEKKWKEYSGFKHAHFLNSATAGLHLAFKVFKDDLTWNHGDEVITTSLTFVSTNHAILYEQLTPVFADVDDSLCLDPTSVEKLITKRTKAIIYVGVGGNAKNYSEILALAKKHNITFILDAAHMAGTKWATDGEHIGLDADCTIFSYQAVKNCPSSDSGMICFKNSKHDIHARRLSWLGIDKSTYDRYSESSYKWRYDVPELGFKYNGNSISAAMCLVSLRYLDYDNTHRRNLAKAYENSIGNNSSIKIVKHCDKILSSRHLFQIMVNDRDNLVNHLANNGVYCGVHYIANHSYKIFQNFTSDCKKASIYSDKLISLPLHMELTEDDVVRITNLILNK
jgi:dTDP-4-amino-4,6-dideoxygalactose transaminase